MRKILLSACFVLSITLGCKKDKAVALQVTDVETQKTSSGFKDDFTISSVSDLTVTSGNVVFDSSYITKVHNHLYDYHVVRNSKTHNYTLDIKNNKEEITYVFMTAPQ